MNIRRQDAGSVASLIRYSLATLGPVASAGAQFALTLALLRVLTPSDFGGFSFLLIAVQFSWGVWSALFCAPLPILLADGHGGARDALLRCTFASNLIGAALASACFLLLALCVGLPPAAAGLFAAYGAVSLLRWYARAHAYATIAQFRTVASDLVYSAVLLAGIPLIMLSGAVVVDVIYGLLLLSATLGLIPFGRAFLAGQFIRVSLRDIAGFSRIWRQHSRWALLGVVTTEATANCHAYIVTFAYGSHGFAPIAASALLIRPITVAMNALTEFERPRMARQIASRSSDLAMGSVRLFRLVLIAAWVATALCIVGLLVYAPRLVFPAQYGLPFLVTGTALWMAVTGMRLLRMPESALMQAAGEFRALAFASVVSCGVSVAAVTALLMAGGPLWSIGGIFIGETLFAIWIWRQEKRWRRRAFGDAIMVDATVNMSRDGSPVCYREAHR